LGILAIFALIYEEVEGILSEGYLALRNNQFKPASIKLSLIFKQSLTRHLDQDDLDQDPIFGLGRKREPSDS